MLYLLAFVIGIVAGLRAMLAPAAIAWAARLGGLHLEGSWLAFMGYRWTAPIWSLVALGEIVNDKLPTTPSRTVPPQFGARVAMGALSGAAIGISAGLWWLGLLLGATGAVAGTLGGAAARGALARAFGRDLPAALTEDAIAIVIAALVVHCL
ncbi:DUF4126 domain-containing protein [Sphingomonas sp. CGMCC 1.13654]|uniref:DUF4126 domain-containing protein n=1 Tax=Sphingomonas chungangi TaxID=2683589 RepID=A0A838L0U3_9SPHN|nr:DUF4126 domain-containing protein [Sphingomonas chungangi]MBA2933113.1 DUF4126 domain-containing protein [Sphingomonas chungangi]MVW56733.1 DUF4126 domain-containing protein [Sphingomonas chungangi]